MKIYLGFAIDQSDVNPAEVFEKWATQIENRVNEHYKSLNPIPLVFFNPFSAYRGAKTLKSHSDIKFLVDVNNMALDSADYAVFIWGNSPSFGMPYEILRKKGHVLVHNISGKSPGLYMKYMLETNTNCHLTDGTDEDFAKKLSFLIGYNEKQNITNPEKG